MNKKFFSFTNANTAILIFPMSLCLNEKSIHVKSKTGIHRVPFWEMNFKSENKQQNK